MAEDTKVAVEAAADETVPAPEHTGRPKTISTSVWVAGKNISLEALKNQAVVNTRDAVPVAAYDKPEIKVTGTKSKQVDGQAGTVWEVDVTYTRSANGPEKDHPVDLERVIKEAQATYGLPAGDPDFLDGK